MEIFNRICTLSCIINQYLRFGERIKSSIDLKSHPIESKSGRSQSSSHKSPPTLADI